jgi:hypothetical protein
MTTHYSTLQMAKDIGFFSCDFDNQLFSTRINAAQFDEVVDDMDLTIERSDVVLPEVVDFSTRILRMSPPTAPEEDISWYQRQVERFKFVSPIILNHAALAGSLPDEARSRVFLSFKSQATASLPWPRNRGW